MLLPPPPGFRSVLIWACSGIPDMRLVRRTVGRLRRLGMEVSDAACTVTPRRYLAGPDEARAEVLHRCIAESSPDVILAARGGFGGARLLDLLDWELLRRSGVRIVGFSDVTAIHLGALTCGLRTSVSGPVAASPLGREVRTEQDRRRYRFTLGSLWHALDAAPREPRRVSLPEGVVLQPLRDGYCEGRVVGVNLAVATSLLGTGWFPDLSGSILVVEDVNEAAYRVDRYLTQLRQAGVLKRLNGLVFGDFRNGEDAEYLPEIFTEFAECVPGPVVRGLPYGHCFPMVSVPVGRRARLRADTSGGECILEW